MKKVLVYLIIVVVFFIIGLVLANYVIMPSLVHRGEEVSVPNVCNLPLKTALQELEQYGLEGVVTERRYDQIIEKNRVIIQEPLPDEKVKKGRIITLTVSRGQEMIKIPYLIGVDFEKGESIIKRHGLIIESIDSVFSDSLVRGKIVATNPGFNTEVKDGSSIKLVVSKGFIQKMPNLIGMKMNEAKDILRKLGLAVGEIKEVQASGTSGNIIVQSPTPEQTVKTGDTVNLMVIK